MESGRGGSIGAQIPADEYEPGKLKEPLSLAFQAFYLPGGMESRRGRREGDRKDRAVHRRENAQLRTERLIIRQLESVRQVGTIARSEFVF